MWVVCREVLHIQFSTEITPKMFLMIGPWKIIVCVCIFTVPIVGSLTEYSLEYSGLVLHPSSGKDKAPMYG